MEAKWTVAMVKEILDTRAKKLDAHSFTHTVLMVTLDSIQLYEGALLERVGPFYLVWTEHHGHFVEHKDEVVRCHCFKRVRQP